MSSSSSILGRGEEVDDKSNPTSSKVAFLLFFFLHLPFVEFWVSLWFKCFEFGWLIFRNPFRFQVQLNNHQYSFNISSLSFLKSRYVSKNSLSPKGSYNCWGFNKFILVSNTVDCGRFLCIRQLSMSFLINIPRVPWEFQNQAAVAFAIQASKASARL